MSILVVAEHDGSRLDPSVASTVAAGGLLGAPVDVLVCGPAAIAGQAARISGVAKVLSADAAWLAHGLPENVAAQTAALAAGYEAILFSETVAGKAVMPRVAALLGVSAVSGVTGIVSGTEFSRQMYAGAANVRVRCSDAVRVATVRPTCFDAKPAAEIAAPVEAVAPVADTGLSEFVSREVVASDRPALIGAKRVVCGGRGLGDEAGFAKLEALADTLGAAIGATRASVDAGHCPNDWQVGQTGKIIAPDLYIGFGISGAIQHIAGIKDAGVIVAVNKDPEAAIFDLADYGLVADAAETVDALREALS